MRKAPQQQGQKGGTEGQHQHVGKFPNHKGCRTDKARRQGGMQE
jgi:hypothetical protein